MRLDASGFRYLTKEDVRLLTAVEMGLKNHEYVPEQLVESIVWRDSVAEVIAYATDADAATCGAAKRDQSRT